MLQFLGRARAVRSSRTATAGHPAAETGADLAPSAEPTAGGTPTIDPSPTGGIEWLPRQAPHRWI